MSNLAELATQAGLVIGDASYRLFSPMRGGRTIVQVERARVASTINLYGGEDLPHALSFIAEDADGLRTLEVHELGRSVCSPECTAWKISTGRYSKYEIAEIDLPTGEERFLAQGRVSTELQRIAPIFEYMAYAGCNYDTPYLAGLIKSMNNGTMKPDPNSTTASSTDHLRRVLQPDYGHNLAFASSKGFLHQMKVLAGV